MALMYELGGLLGDMPTICVLRGGRAGVRGQGSGGEGRGEGLGEGRGEGQGEHLKPFLSAEGRGGARRGTGNGRGQGKGWGKGWGIGVGGRMGRAGRDGDFFCRCGVMVTQVRQGCCPWRTCSVRVASRVRDGYGLSFYQASWFTELLESTVKL